MASAPPMEPDHFGHPQPPTYEETMKAPQCSYNPTQPPPLYGKMPQPAYPSSMYPPPQAHPPFPAEQYSQSQTYLLQQSNAAGPSRPVNVQTVYIQQHMVFGDSPVQVQCPLCAQVVLSRVVFRSGALSWLVCFGLSIVGCFYGCCLIPFCVDSMKDVKHMCPNCNALLGVHKRL